MQRLAVWFKDCRGSLTVITIIMIFLMVGILAFVIDLAHVQTAKNEVQNAADACALRGARAFLPDNLELTGVSEIDPDPEQARLEAQKAILQNRSDNQKFQDLADLPLDQIKVGLWDFTGEVSPHGKPSLLSWEWPPPASYWGKYIGPGVSLPTQRTAESSLGPVVMKFAQIFGINTVPVKARATAALSGVGQLAPGAAGSFPIAINVTKAKAVGYMVFMSPDTPDVGGWTSLSQETASASYFKGLINHTIPNPQVEVGDIIKLQNGVACTAVKEAINYYNTREVSKGVFEPVTPVEIIFPAVQVDKFNQSAKVEGFMAAEILYFRDANAPKDIHIPATNCPKYMGNCMIIIQIKEGIAPGQKGGGKWYGLLSPYPKLVQ